MPELRATIGPTRKTIIVAAIRRLSYFVPADRPVPVLAIVYCGRLDSPKATSPALTTGMYC